MLQGVSMAWCASQAGFALHLGRSRGLVAAWWIGLVVLVAAAKLRSRAAISLGVITIAVSLHSFEARMAWIRPPVATAAAAAGRAWDNRTKADVVDDLRARGLPASPALQPKQILVHEKGALSDAGAPILPLGGISSVRTAFCNEGGEWALFDADEHGFVNPKGLWDGRTIDVALVGDSFTQGACVQPEQSLAGRIRERHPRMLNLGMAGNGPLLELAGIREYLSRAKPRHVLWMYYCNDLYDLLVEKDDPLLARYRDRAFAQGLFDRQARIDRLLRDLVERESRLAPRWPPALAALGLTRRSTPVWMQDLVMGEQHTALAAVVRLDQGSVMVQNRARAGAPDVPMFQEILREARAEVGSWGGTLHFVYLPDMHYQGRVKRDDRHRAAVLGAVRGLGLPLVDIHPRFEAEPDLESLRYAPSTHDNPRGYAVVARVVNEYLDALGR